MNFLVVVGERTCVRFWYDLWCEDSCFKYLLPDLFRLAIDKGASMYSR